ncbi:hypothetical protein [uncultured Phenylobacterium sp.]|uniref:hypothetical protein n=1 Tax=uncultured Phenylobacterium sp. TaxID=349273 RepID=UPI0025F10347|nr:hypothetical protein [uncultured Phenylobacterium sp.]
MDVDDRINLITAELQNAADQIVSSATLGLSLADQLASDEALAGPLRDVLNTILAACAFQDLAGQRLALLADALAGRLPDCDPLVNGPAEPGQGLDQDGADAMFASAGQADA